MSPHAWLKYDRPDASSRSRRHEHHAKPAHDGEVNLGCC